MFLARSCIGAGISAALFKYVPADTVALALCCSRRVVMDAKFPPLWITLSCTCCTRSPAGPVTVRLHIAPFKILLRHLFAAGRPES